MNEAMLIKLMSLPASDSLVQFVISLLLVALAKQLAMVTLDGTATLWPNQPSTATPVTVVMKSNKDSCFWYVVPTSIP